MDEEEWIMETCSTNLCWRTLSLSRILRATWSPVSTFSANLTFANAPSPIVLPSSYLPTRRFALGALIIESIYPHRNQLVSCNKCSKLDDFQILNPTKSNIGTFNFFLKQWQPVAKTMIICTIMRAAFQKHVRIVTNNNIERKKPNNHLKELHKEE